MILEFPYPELRYPRASCPQDILKVRPPNSLDYRARYDTPAANIWYLTQCDFTYYIASSHLFNEILTKPSALNILPPGLEISAGAKF